MTTYVLAGAWAAWVTLGLTHTRDRDRRHRWGLRATSVLAGIGCRLRRWCRRPADRAADLRWGGAAVVALAAVVLAPGLTPVGPLLLVALPVWRQRRQRSRHERQVCLELPEVVDLFRLAASAGLTVVESCRLVARTGTGPVAAAFATAVARMDRGARVPESLERIARTSQALRPLVRLMTSVERYGLALEPALTEVAVLARQDRRRRVEIASRQVAVRLLIPLVVLVLPAFVVLTIVPSLAGSLEHLRR